MSFVAILLFLSSSVPLICTNQVQLFITSCIIRFHKPAANQLWSWLIQDERVMMGLSAQCIRWWNHSLNPIKPFPEAMVGKDKPVLYYSLWSMAKEAFVLTHSPNILLWVHIKALSVWNLSQSQLGILIRCKLLSKYDKWWPRPHKATSSLSHRKNCS